MKNVLLVVIGNPGSLGARGAIGDVGVSGA